MFFKKKVIPKKLHICMVAQKLPLVGRTTHHGSLWPIANGLAQRGHHVTILSWKNIRNQAVIRQENLEAYFLGVHQDTPIGQFPQKVLEKFQELHQKEPFHLVHSIDHCGRFIGRNKKKFQVAMTYNVEATRMSQIFSIIGMSQDTLSSQTRTGLHVIYKYLTTYFGGDRQLLKTADSVFVTSPQQKFALERHYLYPEKSTYLVPYGIEIGDLDQKEQPEALKEMLNLPGNARTVVTMTDMQEMSEMVHLLKAFKTVAIKKPSSRLIVLGEGPFKKQVEFEMLNLALGSKVHFVGNVPNIEIPNYIALADVYVNLSSRTSGFDPSLLEAMAQQHIVIGSEVSSISTVIDDGVDGFLLRPADSHSLSKLLIQIFSDQIPAAQIGEAARKKVTDLFDMEKMINQTEKAYFRTLRQK